MTLKRITTKVPNTRGLSQQFMDLLKIIGGQKLQRIIEADKQRQPLDFKIKKNYARISSRGDSLIRLEF